MAKKSLKLTRSRWETSRRIEDLYSKLLRKLMDPAKKKVINKIKEEQKRIEKENKQSDPKDKKEVKVEVDEIKKILEDFAKNPVFKRKADEISKKIVTMTLAENAKDWRDAARKASRNPEMYDLLMKELEQDKEVKAEYDRLLAENAKLIKTLPLEIAKEVVDHVSAKSFASSRPEVIAKEIKKFFPHHTRAKEQLIARTESAKCKAALTEARSKSIDVYWYVWHSTGDQRTRPAHALMNNVICNYHHQPSPEALAKKKGKYEGKTYGNYGPGGIFNCRCFAEPIIELSLINFPSDVYDWEKDDIIRIGSAKQFIEYAKEKGNPVKTLEDYEI